MKLVCPICKGRSHALYIRVRTPAGTYQPVAIDDAMLCTKDGVLELDAKGNVLRTLPLPKGARWGKVQRQLEADAARRDLLKE